MQVFLLTSKLSIYGFSPNNIEKKDVFKNAGILSMSGISNYSVDSLCSAFLLFPIIGYVVSTFIIGGVAIGTTYYAGKKCIIFVKKFWEKK